MLEFDQYISVTAIIYLLVCYLLGSIPTAYILVMAIKKVDIRTVGSGNIGATNAGRVLGKSGFYATFALDVLKSFVPVMLYVYFVGDLVVAMLGGIVVILGHAYSIYLKFQGGGKGVATGLGVGLAVFPLLTLILLLVFGLLVLLFRMVSLASILSAILLLVSTWFVYDNFVLNMLISMTAVYVVIKHKSNIGRILKGTESKIGTRV